MTYPRSVLRQYWAGERPRLWRIGRWMLGIALILTPFAFFFQTPRNVTAFLIVAMIVIVVGRRLLAGRDMHAVLLRRWQREMSLHVQAAWPARAHAALADPNPRRTDDLRRSWDSSLGRYDTDCLCLSSAGARA